MSSKEKARRDKSKNKSHIKNMKKKFNNEEDQQDILTNGDYEKALYKKKEVIEEVIEEENENLETNQDKPKESESIPEEEFNEDYFKQDIVK